ncbi:reverse transcriptase domain-containing protein [Tanacetum coccineum]
MSTHSGPSPTTNTSAVRNTVRRGKEKSQENLNEPASDAALREFCDKNYNQLLPILAKKMHQEKVQQEKLKAVKARLNFEETSQYSESGAQSRRRDITLKERSGKRDGVQKIGKGCIPQSSRSRGTEPAPKRHHDRKAYSRKGGRMLESEDSAGGHWKSKSKKQRSSMEDEDLSQPWATAKLERWAMPTWCHMFNSTLTENARVWFDDLLPKSIDGYDNLKEAFLTNYLQQKKCIKDPVEIHHIKQREGESTEDFVQRFKIESRDVKRAPEVMRISGFMHGITNPELIKRLHDKIPKSIDEMWKITTSFLRGEVAAGNQERKKTFPPWKQQDAGHRQNFKKGGFKNQQRKVQSSSSNDNTGGKRNARKFCEFHGEVGHTTDECMHLKRQIEEMLKAGKLSHLIKELKQNNGKDQAKVAKKGEVAGKDKPLAILMVQSRRKIAKQRTTQTFSSETMISFPPLGEEDGTEGPMVIEAEVRGHLVHRMYIDGGTSSEILYEHCFNQLRPEIRNQMVPATTYLVGFSGEIIWPLGQVSLLVKIGDEEHSTSAWMNFMVVRSHSPYNGIIGRPGVRRIKAIPSTAHGMLKFPVTGGTVTLRSSRIIPLECAMISGPRTQQPVVDQVTEEKIQVAIHPEYPEQTIAIGSTLTEEGRKKLCGLLRQNLDIFAWKPADMTGVPRHIAEHRLNVREGCFPVRQKKRGQAPERNKAICEEVEKLVNAGIMKEVHYHSWLSNPVMVKKHDKSWKMCVDFKDLNKACPKDGYPLPKIE